MSADDALRDAYIARARALLEMERYEDAGGLAQQALGLDPDSVMAQCQYAQARLGAGDHAEAYEVALRASANDPASTWSLRIASRALINAGRHDEAIRFAREAIRLDPHEWQCHVILATALSKRRATADEAEQLCRSAIDLAPSHPLPSITAGHLARERRDYGAARQHFLRVLELDPQNSTARTELATLDLVANRGFNPIEMANNANDFASALTTAPGNNAALVNLQLAVGVMIFKVAALDTGILLITATTTNYDYLMPLPVIPALIPVAYAAHFIFSVKPSVRRYAVRLLRSEPGLGLLAFLDLVAVSCGIIAGTGLGNAQAVATVAIGCAMTSALLFPVGVAVMVIKTRLRKVRSSKARRTTAHGRES